MTDNRGRSSQRVREGSGYIWQWFAKIKVVAYWHIKKEQTSAEIIEERNEESRAIDVRV